MSNVITSLLEDHRFLWGVSTSGYQCEGGYNQKGTPHNNWSWGEVSGKIPKSGLSADFWNQAEDDIARAQLLGLTAFRLTLEWSRIQPCLTLPTIEGSSDLPDFDDHAIRRYAEIIACCRKHHLEPIITWHHFTHPAWLGANAWAKNQIIPLFIDFIQKTLERILPLLLEKHQCQPPHFHLTINEPNMLSINQHLTRFFPGGNHFGVCETISCQAKLLQAHLLALQTIHSTYNSFSLNKPAVSYNTFASDVYPVDMAWMDLLTFASSGGSIQELPVYLKRHENQFNHRWINCSANPSPKTFITMTNLLSYSNAFDYRTWIKHPEIQKLYHIASECESIADYWAFDFYDPCVSNLLRKPRWIDLNPKPQGFMEWMIAPWISKWWDWSLIENGMTFFTEEYARRGKPILIAENGISYRCASSGKIHPRTDGMTRSRYIFSQVQEVTQMKQAGLPLIGYLHWSLTDNYEWGTFSPRFGLFSIDYSSPRRTRQETSPEGDLPSQTYAFAIRSAQELISQ